MIPLGIYAGNPEVADMGITEALGIAVVGIGVVLLILALLALFIKVLSAVIGAFSKKPAEAPAPAAPAAPVAAAAPAGVPLPATQSEGKLDLVNVDEPTAACIMAIVSNESGIPLNRLAFKSIRLMEDK